jgi:hypothetical protein
VKAIITSTSNNTIQKTGLAILKRLSARDPFGVFILLSTYQDIKKINSPVKIIPDILRNLLSTQQLTVKIDNRPL